MLRSGTKTIHELGREFALNDQQIAFCEAYIHPECNGSNGKQAAAKAYNYDLSTRLGNQNASNTACRNLKHPQVNLLISILLDCQGLNANYIDRRMMELIEQRADSKTAVLAIREANLVLNRIKSTVEVITKPTFDFTVLTEDELKQFIAITERAAIRYQETQHIPLLPSSDT